MANLSFAIDIGSEIITPIISQLSAKSGALVGLGKWVLAACLVAELLVELYAYFIGGGLQILLQRLFRLMLVFSIPLAALMGWGAFSGAIAGFGVNDMASAVGGGAGPASAVMKIVKAFETAHSHMIDALMGKPVSAMSVRDIITVVLPRIPIIVLGLLFLALFVLTSIVFLFALLLGLYMPLIMLKIGMIFGPVLVATWAFSPLAGFARSWLSYMVSQAFSYAVAILLASVAANVAVSIFGRFAALQIKDPMDIMAMVFGIVIVSLGNLFMAYLLIRSDNIAAAMVGGPNPGSGAEYLGTKMAGAVAGAVKGALGKSGDASKKGGDKGGNNGASSPGAQSSGNVSAGPSAGAGTAAAPAPAAAPAGAGVAAASAAGGGAGAGGGAAGGGAATASAAAGAAAAGAAAAGAAAPGAAGAGAAAGGSGAGGAAAGGGARRIAAKSSVGTGGSSGIASRIKTAASQKLQSIDGKALAKSVARSAVKVAAVAAIGSAAGPGVIGAGAAAAVLMSRKKNAKG